jgi:hypothetical protein
METLLDLNPDAFRKAWNKAPLGLRHRLSEHPLLTVEAVAELADFLPTERVEHNLGNLPKVVRSDAVERVDMTPGEIARTIDTNGCWMVLKNIERHPDYGRLLDDCLDEVAPYVPASEGPMTERNGYIFLSAPGSVTPLHTDDDNNLLLQIRNDKRMNVGAWPNQQVEQEQLERYFAVFDRNLPQDLGTTLPEFHLQPGDGIYVPWMFPHWVKNGEGVSVSFSITWHTEASKDRARIHAMNARLRKLRLSPAMPGVRRGSDQIKVAMAKAAGRVSR